MVKLMKALLFVGLVGLFANSSFAAGKKNMKETQWFDKIGCEKMRIIQYKSVSEKEIEKQFLINDPAYIQSFQTQINQLPPVGDMMIKMGPQASYLTLEFSCGGKTETIEFYNSKIKTPATSFYSQKESPEKNIWEEIQLHFAKPAFGKALLKIKNVPHKWDEFSVEYLGSEDRTPKGTTATLNVESFKVSDEKGAEQIIEVRSGQLPPRPEKFKVGSKQYVLSTFSMKDGSRIYPRFFVIDKE